MQQVNFSINGQAIGIPSPCVQNNCSECGSCEPPDMNFFMNSDGELIVEAPEQQTIDTYNFEILNANLTIEIITT